MATDSEVLIADLSELLAILGMSDHARPQSPHQVFQEALTALRARLSADQSALERIADPIGHMARAVEPEYEFNRFVANEIVTPQYLSKIAQDALTDLKGLR